MPSCLKPLQGEPLVFFHVGGDVIWRGDGRCTPIARAQAEALRELYGDEADAAYCCGDRRAAKLAGKLYLQITHAMDAQDAWKRLFADQTRKAA
jgi:hypothetical protein